MLLPLLALLAATPAADPSDRLVEEAQRLARQRYPRPSHVSLATPGRFGDELLEALEALQPSYRAHEALPADVREACREASAGIRPLPLPCFELAVTHALAAQAVLSATHALEAGMPADLRALSAPNASAHAYGWLLLQHAAQLASYLVTIEVESRRPEPAVDRCLDILALGRDVMHGTGLLGLAVGESIEALALRPCARAIDLAPMARKRQALDQLERIREGLPPFSVALHQERVQSTLAAYGALLEPRLRASLPPEALALVGNDAAPKRPLERAMLRASQLDYAEYMETLMASADLPPAKRHDRFVAARERMKKSLNPLSQAASPDFEPLAARSDRARAMLDVLVEAARVDLLRTAEPGSRWPPPSDAAHVTVTPLHGGLARISAVLPRDDVYVTIGVESTQVRR